MKDFESVICDEGRRFGTHESVTVTQNCLFGILGTFENYLQIELKHIF